MVARLATSRYGDQTTNIRYDALYFAKETLFFCH